MINLKEVPVLSGRNKCTNRYKVYQSKKYTLLNKTKIKCKGTSNYSSLQKGNKHSTILKNKRTDINS